jgi:hypothetical protein
LLTFSIFLALVNFGAAGAVRGVDGSDCSSEARPVRPESSGSDCVVNELGDLGVGFVSLTESLNFGKAARRAMISTLLIFAEFELDIIRGPVKAQKTRMN